MPPSFQGLLIVFLFAIPGYMAMSVYKTKYPIQYYRETQSPIEQVSLFVFLSAFVNILVVSLWGMLWAMLVSWNQLPQLSLDLIKNLPNSSIGIVVIFTSLIAYLIIALLLSILCAEILSQLLPIELPLLMQELRAIRAIQILSQKDPWILVRLKNGDQCLGFISEVRWVGNKENSIELIFEKTYYQKINETKKENIGRIFLKSEDVLWLSSYVARTSPLPA